MTRDKQHYAEDSPAGAIAPAHTAIDTRAIDACVEDARLAALDSEAGPSGETNFDRLLQRLEAAKVRLPLLYHNAAHVPFVGRLNTLGSSGFTHLLVRNALAGKLLQDIAHSILQNGERFEDVATDAFEEVVTDLYDGFLSAQDRKGIKTPDRLVLPPLVKWGNPGMGPYTWPADATMNFDIQCAIVSLPPANTRRGLMAWATLAHETAGHDILHADKGLQAELEGAIFNRLTPLGLGLDRYWAARVDESASDVMGILNMGPAAAIGMISFIRGLLASLNRPARLRTDGSASDTHPADILRGYLGAETVRQLSFAGAGAWSDLITAQTDDDAAGASTFNIGGTEVPKKKAKESAAIVAETIATHKAEILRKHALIDIQDWRDRDEKIAREIVPALVTSTSIPDEVDGAGVYAAHVVAASVYAALAGQVAPAIVFQRMVAILKEMHDGNPSWGPLHVVHPSSIYFERAFVI